MHEHSDGTRLPQANDEALRELPDPTELKSTLARTLCRNPRDPIWRSDSPALDATLECPLPAPQLDALAALGLVGGAGPGLAWSFMPVVGPDLLLFRDLPVRRFERQYVWLRTKTTSTSWRVADAAAITPGLRVLDLGCGSGLNALRAAAMGAESAGIDINPRAVRLARVNAALNGLGRVAFTHSGWGEFDGPDFDVVVSQPPFDPAPPNAARSGGGIYAFDGGAELGLGSTAEIVERFQPRRSGQRMLLYVHSFARAGTPLLGEILESRLRSGNTCELEPIKSYAIGEWWESYRERHRLGDTAELPEEWRSFEQVQAFYARVRR